MNQNTNNNKCYYCGSDRYEHRRVEFLYSLHGKYMLVPDMPAEVCLNCGMIYYPGSTLLEVERRFLAIEHNLAKPDRCIELPVVSVVA